MSEELKYRSFQVRAGDGADVLPRGVITSEQPVYMWDGERGDFIPEVLLISGMQGRAESIRLVDTHDTSSVRNILGSFRNIEHRAADENTPWPHATGDIDISGAEADIAQKVREGHITEMSAGYSYSGAKSIHIPEGETQTIEGRELTGPVNVRTGWSLQEASLVPIGADNQAQIGAKSRGFRSLDDARAAISRNIEETPNTPDGLTSADGGALTGAVTDDGGRAANAQTTKPPIKMKDETIELDGAAIKEATESGIKAGREDFEKRADSIMAIGQEVGDPSWAIAELRAGKSVEEVQRAAITKLKESTANAGYNIAEPIGLDEKETRTYSLARAMHLMAQRKPVDGIEGEASRAIADLCGEDPDGMFIAPEILAGSRAYNGQRDMTAGTTGDGEELVSTDLRPGDFIDVLRANMVTAQLGVRTLTGLVGDVAIPRLTAGTVATWAGNEITTAFTEDELEFDQVTLSPQHLGITSQVSKQLLTQSTPDIDSLLRNDFNAAIAVAMDQSVLRGTGTGQPQGIDGATSVGTVTITTAGNPDLAELVEFISDLDTGNALRDNAAWVTTPAVRGFLMQTLLSSGVSGYMWDSSNNTVLGYPAYSTSNADTNDIFFGSFDDYVLGFWPAGLDLIVDPYTNATTRLINYTIGIQADGDVRRPASFSTNA